MARNKVRELCGATSQRGFCAKLRSWKSENYKEPLQDDAYIFIAAVGNYHQVSGFKWHRFFILHFQRSKVQNQSHWPRVEVLAFLVPPGGSERRIHCYHFHIWKAACIPWFVAPSSHHSYLLLLGNNLQKTWLPVGPRTVCQQSEAPYPLPYPWNVSSACLPHSQRPPQGHSRETVIWFWDQLDCMYDWFQLRHLQYVLRCGVWMWRSIGLLAVQDDPWM